jgi:ParB family transcriptional regulator, chromosome partitioning protein
MTTTTAEKVVTEAEKAAPDKRRALGRGLDSLLPGGPRVVTPATVGPMGAAAQAPAGGEPASHLPSPSEARDAVVQILLEHIEENPYQTRNHFGPDALEELANSIHANGVVQPVVVRPGADGRFLLILGERRCRASKLAGKTTIPAIVRRVSDQQAAEMTVVENLQRQDLNCIEQAAAFSKLSRDFGLTQEQIGQRVGVSRESVSNYMRLLKLPAAVLQHLQEGRLGFSEARVLLQLLDPDLIAKVADEAVRKHLSVAQLEELVDHTNVPMVKEENPHRARWVDPNVRAAQTEMERALGMRVRIRDRKGKGKIVIEYSTLEDFDRVVEMLKGR